MKKKTLFALGVAALLTLAGCGGSGADTTASGAEDSSLPDSNSSDSSISHEHSWQEATYTWSENHSTCTARRVCEEDPSHVEEETATSTYEVIEDAKCEGEGLGRYTASFENPAFKTQTIEVTVPALGHDYQFDSFVWEGYEAKAKYVCSRDGSVEFHDAEVTSIVTKEPTCEEDGVRTYTASYDGHTDSKTETIPALGHDYQFDSFVWEGFTARAKYVCTRDGSEEYHEAKVTSEVTTEPTCDEDGVRTYTASYGGHTDTKTETIPALGHEWGEATYAWSEDYSTCTATRVCLNDPDHIETETARSTSEVLTRPTYDSEGFGRYTAVFANPSFETQVVERTIAVKSKLRFILSNDKQSYVAYADSGAISGEIVIPDTYNGLPVTSIGASAFYGCSSLTSVTIGSGVTSIGEYAFENCTSLTSVTVPDSVTSIGGYAFQYCTSLASVTIGSGVTSIGNCTFQTCTSLTSVTIPDSVASIGYYAFQYCSSLASITIPDSVTYIGGEAFSRCSSLVSVTIGSGVTSIGYSAFQYCYRLVEVINKSSLAITEGSWENGYVGYYAKQVISDEEGSKLSRDADGFVTYNDGTDVWLVSYEGEKTDIEIPSNVTKINKYAFYDCRSLTSITIPDSVTSIGEYAFYDCRSLTSITIPDSVTSIGEYEFYDCRSLTSITIPDSVTSIGGEAFSRCSSLVSVTIGSGVTSIGYSAFQYCYRLVEVINKSSLTINDYVGYYAKQVISDEEGSKLSRDADGFVTYNDGTDVWLVSYEGEKTDIEIPSNVTKINKYAFYDCRSLTSITIPDSVTSIGDYVFCECTSLTSVTVPDSVTSIGEYAFYDCRSLTSITIPDSVTSIGDYVFCECTSLTSVTVPDSVTSIGRYAFYKCSSLASITIPDSVTSIGYQAFYGCGDLQYNEYDNAYYLGNESNPHVALMKGKGYDVESCVVNENCKVIANSAFSGYSSLVSVTIPDSVISIDNFAFRGCSSLSSVTIGNGVTSIGASAFEDCSSLTSVTIPDSVTSIGQEAFRECSSLSSVTIGNGVTSIGASAFYGCSSLTSVTVPDSVTSIGGYAFQYCTSLASVTIGSGVTSIGGGAFSYCTSLATITFNGTMEQWSEVDKKFGWRSNVPATVVHCIDGDVNL